MYSADLRIYLELDDEIDRKIDISAIGSDRHMTEPWLDQALMDSAYKSDPVHFSIFSRPNKVHSSKEWKIFKIIVQN